MYKNKWNGKMYKLISEFDNQVTLERSDGSQFIISKKEFYANYREYSSQNTD